MIVVLFSSFPRGVQASCEPIHFPPVGGRCVIQGDSGRQVNIVGGDRVGHFEKKKSHGRVSNSE